ncbi:hypothetical protein HN020_06740 [Brevibacillus borstelensis]|uniref:hypothetical protein n=2 Tax=Brevibacillus borstelensis TaxID=45462 RepID=UPI00149041F6|nr:hypothetical protein [Brevibacillus borstelensis]MBE5398412.1 hypothetical protein [Brevibacillus borstelensis]MCM3590525.1 hypothetical protein [Brevibacillus borstelensis]NOU54471.1 hypothetical protein [Brevibacillus borstelensis]
MLGNFLKNSMLIGISAVMLVVPSISFAKENKNKVSTKKKLEYFEQQYESTRDFDKALEALSNKYGSIQVKSKKETTKKVEGENNSEISPQFVYSFKYDESIIYDDDSDQYVYLGEWWWGDIVGSQPWDFIGVFTNNEDTMPISGGSISIKGYDYRGKRTVYFDTAEGSRTKKGSIELATRISNGGVGFWFNEKYVESGLITAYLEDASTEFNDRIQMQYEHSRTSTSLTGIGGSAGLGSAGFNVSWQRNVEKDGPYWSTGAYLELN